jgi:hypothetical protein
VKRWRGWLRKGKPDTALTANLIFILSNEQRTMNNEKRTKYRKQVTKARCENYDRGKQKSEN